MKIFGSFLPYLLLAAVATDQQVKAVFEFKGSIDFQPRNERIHHALPFNGGSKLLLIGKNEIKHVDAGMARMLGSYTQNISGLLPRGFLRKLVAMPEWLSPSPDGTRGILIEKPDGGKSDAAVVWDFRTGKRAAVLERTLKPARESHFSENGETIVSTHGHLKEMEICFWDGETYALRSSIVIKNLGWYHLSRDGARLLTASGEANKWLGLSVTDYEDSKTIDVWDTASGKLEKSITSSVSAIGPYPKASSDGRHVAALSGNKIVVWDSAASPLPRYEVPHPAEKNFQLVGFSDDSRYLMAYSKEKGRIYEAETGKLYREFDFRHADSYEVSPGGKYAVIRSRLSVSIYDIEADKTLYGIPLRTVSVQTDSSNQYLAEEQYVGRIRISPDEKFVMVFGDEPIRILDARTGNTIQTLVDPQRAAYTSDGKIKSSGLAVDRAGWLAGGDAIYVLRGDLRSALFWSAK